MVFLADIVLEGFFEGGIFTDGNDFVGEFFGVPKIVFEARPNDFGDAGLFGKNETVTVVCGFESSESEWFGNRTHNENVGNGVDVAKFLTANEAGEDDIS